MIKKIVAILCAVSLLAVPSAMASDNSSGITDKEAVIEAVGIELGTVMHREAFIKALGGFIYDSSDNYTAESLAYNLGLVESGDEFNGKESITIDEALKYAVITLGYKPALESMGGYNKIAGDLKLLNGISDSLDSRLKYDNAVHIIFNMMEAAPMKLLYNSKDAAYGVDKESNLLELNRDIYKIEGMVTADAYTALYEAKGTGDIEYAKIDSREYHVGDTNPSEYLGMNITAYVEEYEKDEYKILYITQKHFKNKTLKINADDIEYVADDYSYIEYNNGERNAKAHIEVVPGIIYNGISYADYTVSDLHIDEGELFLIDNDNNGEYDIIRVTSYNTVVVSAVDTEDGIITNRYTFDDAIKILTLDRDEGIEYFIYDSEGNETDISAIGINDILSVAKSKSSGDSLVKIFISGNEAVTGAIEGRVDSEFEITINGEVYNTSQDFLDYLTSSGKQAVPGNEYVFYFDCFGNVAYLKTVMNFEYSLLYRIADMEDDTYTINYMDMDCEWQTLSLANYVKLDDERMSATAVYSELLGCEPQLVKLKLNNNNEVKAIDRAEISESYNEDKFTKTPVGKYVYRSGPKSLGMKYHLKDKAKVIIIPENTKNKHAYDIKDAVSYFATDKPYTVTAYDCNRFNFTSVITVKEDAEAMQNAIARDFFVVNQIMQKAVDDEILPVAVGNLGEYINVTLVGSEADTFDGIKPGDVINLAMNSIGRVSAINKVFSMSDFKNLDVNEYYVATASIAGSVEDIDLDEQAIRINCGKTTSFRISPTAHVLVTNPSKGISESKTASVLKAGSKILIRLTWGQITEIVCLDE